jgi:hypothetical protein
MHPTLPALMANQHGLFTRRQALAAGVDARWLDRAVRVGTFVRVWRGVYCLAEHWEALARWEDRQVQRDRAARLRVSMPHVASHHTSGLLLGMGLLHPPTPLTHITRPGVVGSHLRHGVKHHLAPFHEEQVRVIDDVRVLEPARTALDIARELGHRHGMVAADSAYRIGATKRDFELALEHMHHWPQVNTARGAYEAADPDTDSVAESLARELVEELGFGRPRTQFGLTADGRVVWIDLILHRHAFEVHGKLKFQTIDDGGVVEDPAQKLLDEKKRQDWIAGFKIGTSGICWEDFWGDRRAVAVARLRREYLETVRLFGTDRSDLARYRPRTPRRRPTLPPAA